MYATTMLIVKVIAVMQCTVYLVCGFPREESEAGERARGLDKIDFSRLGAFGGNERRHDESSL